MDPTAFPPKMRAWCAECGTEIDDLDVPCPKCLPDFVSHSLDELETCPACDGSGEGVADSTCRSCSGYGVVSHGKAARIRESMRPITGDWLELDDE